MGGHRVTLLGLGTYRSHDAATSASVAASAGCPLIDTAPVYGNGKHQSAIAPVLREHPSIRVTSKVGYMTKGQAQVALSTGDLTGEDVRFRHSIAPEYVLHQIAMSRTELRRPVLDVVYLHNPEHDHQKRGDLHKRIRDAFGALEEATASGAIRGYGVATWSGFDTGAFTVHDLVRLAQEAAGRPETGLRAIQLPASLVKIAPIRDALLGNGPIGRASEAGLEVWASAPLHGGKLVRLVNERLARYISEGASPVEAALLVTASAPGLTGMLISTSSTEHWANAASVVGGPLLPETRIKDISDLLLREHA
ncbi:aldo/keto reductase [Nocardiopsis lucentensis]|uniref:aldo/keto reductase n=1 Tax=Nocardiopsis lucentensis TaxID=53441 RepID=UPI003084039D